LINIIPPHLWHLIHHELYKLTPEDASNFPAWNHKWISDKHGCVKTMKSLVLKAARGSMIYEVDVGFRGLGKSKNGFELFCEVLIGLMEEEKMKKEDKFQLRILKLYVNSLKDIHIETLFKLVKICPKLERLWLCGNEFTRKGCWKVVRMCRDYKLEILFFGNEGWSIGLHKYQKRLGYAPWMRETDECFQLINKVCLIAMQYPSYAFNEALFLPDLKELFGYPSLKDAKYQYDFFFPVGLNFASELSQIWNLEKPSRPDVITLMIKGKKLLEEHLPKLMISNPNISSIFDVIGCDDVVKLANPQILKQILDSLDANTANIFGNLLSNNDVVNNEGIPEILKQIVGLFDVNTANTLGNQVTNSSILGNDELKID
jgi:hypothetical protein